MSVSIRPARDKVEILIVEPVAHTRQLLQDMLKNNIYVHACKIYPAATAKEAWSAYLSYGPDLAFISTELPEVDGYRLAQLFQVIDAKAQCVMTAKEPSKDYAQQVKECGAKGILVMPYDLQQLQPIINRTAPPKKTAGKKK